MGNGKTDQPDGVMLTKQEIEKRLSDMWLKMQAQSWAHLNEIYLRTKQ